MATAASTDVEGISYLAKTFIILSEREARVDPCDEETSSHVMGSASGGEDVNHQTNDASEEDISQSSSNEIPGSSDTAWEPQEISPGRRNPSRPSTASEIEVTMTFITCTCCTDEMQASQSLTTRCEPEEHAYCTLCTTTMYEKAIQDINCRQSAVASPLTGIWPRHSYLRSSQL